MAKGIFVRNQGGSGRSDKFQDLSRRQYATIHCFLE